MRRRRLLALFGTSVLAVTVRPARADDFMALATGTLRGDPARLGWSSLRAGFRVAFPAAASGRSFMDRRHAVIDAVERALERTRYDPEGEPAERERLARIIADTVRRAAPRGTVSRVYDVWIEAR